MSSRSDLLNDEFQNGTSIQFEGRISFWEENDQKIIYYLEQCVITDGKGRHISLSKLLVYFKTNYPNDLKNIMVPAAGNIIHGSGKIYSFEKVTNPGQFDQYFYYKKNDISASITADHIKIVDASVNQLKEKMLVFRKWWKCELINEIGEHYGSVMGAIFLGDKHGIDAELKELYQKSGIGHLLAISGLHMSFLGIGVYQMLRRAGCGFVSSGIVGIAFLFLYYLMIGESVSAIRALIMFVIKMGAEIVGRTYDMLTSVAIAAVIIALWRPLYLLDSGFILSFTAILGIAVLNPLLIKHKVPKLFSGGLSIQIMTLPWMLYFYYEIPVYSFAINLVVIPLMSVIFACGVLAPVVGILWTQGRTFLLRVCALILWAYEKICGYTIQIPFHRIVSGKSSKSLVVVYYILLFSALLIRKYYETKKKDIRWLIISIRLLFACECIILLFGKKIFISNSLDIVMLDVGQGEAIYIHTPEGKNILIDNGSTSVSSVGKYRVEPFLKSEGISKIDYAFVSHGDEDHISGFEEMLENQILGIKIDQLVLPSEKTMSDSLWQLAYKAEQNGTRVSVIYENDVITEKEMTICCLEPEEGISDLSDNAASMVLCVQYRKFKMLFTGDFEGNEQKLAKKVKECNILKVAHHGSKNSTSIELLQRIHPQIALISSGKNNRYGHPHEETIERLRKYTKRIYNTQKSGAIKIHTDGYKIEIDEYVK